MAAAQTQLHIITTLFSLIVLWDPFNIAADNGYANVAPNYIDDVAINCGYFGNSTGLDGRKWFGDEGTRSFMSKLQPTGKSKRSMAERSLFADPIPYMTARISAAQFFYTFQVNPGQKFIRLHFYPSTYSGFEMSQDLFTVKAGPFTLLRNFSASLAADAMGVRYIMKEFCLYVEENKFLNLTFSASKLAKHRNVYAFVNGLEIISIPTGLYYTPDGDLGVPVVGWNNRYYHIDNITALEMVQRLNIGGSYISPMEDFGMFRRWTEDVNYLIESRLQPKNHLVHGINTGVYDFSAPVTICHTSWQTDKNGKADEMYNLTWMIPVDLGFGYLVRLHFCDFGLLVKDGRPKELNVLIDNKIAEAKVDVIRLSGRTGVQIYRDYMVMVRANEELDKYDLSIVLQSSDSLAIGHLRGLEIFKLSNLDNNLASRNHIYPRQFLTSWNLKIKNFVLEFERKNAIATGITIILILLNITVFKLRQKWEQTCNEQKDTISALRKLSYHRFSLAEINSATQNFNDAFLIGKGGFGYVYRGFVCAGLEVAVKRLKSNSKQGAHEFWTEIETLSKIRHKHLVSLLGYCNEYQEMILVYEYMPRGTLADNLYKIGRNGEDGTSLTWDQRLRICIGAARGLDYLHTGIENEIIHRDVKDSNILLDNNLEAKISDFGLSKVGNVSESQGHLSTKVKGTPGFVDPDYFLTHKPTTKVDVYAFGIVMLVVLCGRPAIDRSIPWEPLTLVSQFRESKRKGDINDIIDQCIRGKISAESLNEFLKSVENCLQTEPKERPTMCQVVTRLECALEKQQNTFSSESEAAAISGQTSDAQIMESLSNFPVDEESLKYAVRHEGISQSSRFSAERGSDEAYPHVQIFSHPNLRVFSFSELKAATINFRNDTVLREGAFGKVYKGFLDKNSSLKDSGRSVIAVKRLNSESSEGLRELQSEVKFFGSLSHPNIVKLLGYCLEGKELLLVYEFMQMGSLDNHLFQSVSAVQPLLWDTRLKILIGAARGLAFLHASEKPIIFRDFKSSKILLDGSYIAKISDFGLARNATESHVSTRVMGTYGYAAPEYVATGHLHVKSDVYSFGVVLIEMLTGLRVIDAKRPAGQHNLVEWIKPRLSDRRKLKNIMDVKLEGKYPLNAAVQIAQLSLTCLQPYPRNRPSMKEVVDALVCI